MLHRLVSFLLTKLKAILRRNQIVSNLYDSTKVLHKDLYDFITIQNLTACTLEWLKILPRYDDVIMGIQYNFSQRGDGNHDFAERNTKVVR
jgi:hypothetical protein